MYSCDRPDCTHLCLSRHALLGKLLALAEQQLHFASVLLHNLQGQGKKTEADRSG